MFIKFRCRACGCAESVDVPEKAHAVDIVLWLNTVVMLRVWETHKRVSPVCLNDKFDLAVPMDPNAPLGKVTGDVERFDRDTMTIFDKLDASDHGK